jgi:hypothetical protein
MRTEAARQRAQFEVKEMAVVFVIAIGVSILVKVFTLHLPESLSSIPWLYAGFLGIRHALREVIQEELDDVSLRELIREELDVETR